MTDWSEHLTAAKRFIAQAEAELAIGSLGPGTESLMVARLELWNAIDNIREQNGAKL